MYFTDVGVRFSPEELQKIVEEEKGKNYVLISPSVLSYDVSLVRNATTANLFAAKDFYTEYLANEIITDLTVNSSIKERDLTLDLDLKLFYDDKYDSFPKDMNSPVEMIEYNKDKIIALQRTVLGYQRKPSYVYRNESYDEPIYEYHFVNFKMLLDKFAEKGIKYEIDIPQIGDRRDEEFTTFHLTYTLDRKR